MVLCINFALPTYASLTFETITLPSLIDYIRSHSENSVKQAAIVIAEVLPLVSTKLLEKIQKWDFMNPASLLTYDTTSGGDTLTITQNGQSMIA